MDSGFYDDTSLETDRYGRHDEVRVPTDAEIQADIDAVLEAQIAEACAPDPSLPFC